ncbi:helix-turn-helix domain-containing protein [Streptomyces sp. NPDC058614]|uniref:helix-turn-helix domain-containing protein n=1 Tax=Streptomyces sp. NPDC058614 TaxID=3346557 RepID=UPI0036465BE7
MGACAQGHKSAVPSGRRRRSCPTPASLLPGSLRLAELRKPQHTTQVQVAEAMGGTQARVSRIEKGQLERSEVDTLAAYVKALGGKLKIVADFGDETYVLG